MNLCSILPISTFNEFIYFPNGPWSFKSRPRCYLLQITLLVSLIFPSKTFISINDATSIKFVQSSAAVENEVKETPKIISQYYLFHPIHRCITILTRKNCSIQLVQEFIEIEAWLLLAFFICLHNQLISTHSIVTY